MEAWDMKKILSCIVLWAVASSAQAAIVFSELNAFGASMAVSNLTPFTNGNAYIDYLASDLGIVTINNLAAGGDNYPDREGPKCDIQCRLLYVLNVL